MAVDRVKFQEIVASQLPRYVREDFPLLSDFLEQYYVSQQYQGGPVDIINNIDQYVKVEELYDIVESTTLAEDLDYNDRFVTVVSTDGFSETNGIFQIDNERLQAHRKRLQIILPFQLLLSFHCTYYYHRP